jgi:archaellum component FlaC
MEYFFKRLEAYIRVRPTAAMRDIIVKIMVEVISILGIVTKEIRQGRTSMCLPPVDVSRKLDLPEERYLKKLFGRKDVEDALQRLDKFTQEEVRMAAAETLIITRGIDDKVNDVDERLGGVDVKVEGIQDQVHIGVEGLQDQVHIVDSKVDGIQDHVHTIDSKVEGVDNRVRGVDLKVSSVVEGKLYRISPPPNLFSALPD